MLVMPAFTLGGPSDLGLLSNEEIQEIARMPNGTNLLLDLVREGRVTPAAAVEAIDQQPRTRESRVKSFWMTLARVFLSR
jgi:hypothetical protein